MNKNLYSLEIEQNTLCILMTSQGVDEHVESLTEKDFYSQKNSTVFSTIKKLHSQGADYDIEVVFDSVRKMNIVGIDDEYLQNIYVNSTGSAHKIGAYVEKLKEYTRRRLLFDAGEQIKRVASDITQYDSIQAVSQSESILAQLENNDDSDSIDSAFNISIDLFKNIDERMKARAEGREEINGVRTGLTDLDNQIGAIQNTDLVIIGARPSMGKTAFAQTLMLNISFLQQKPVLMQSAEMSKQQIGARLVAALVDINLKYLTSSNIPDHHWGDFVRATDKLKAAKLLIDDKQAPSLADIRKNCRKLKQKYGYVGAVFVDYLTLLKSPLQTDNQHQAIGAITKGLKGIAKEFNCPVFCLAQLSRKVEERKDKRPMNSDLRESGSIEEDANIILFLYRDEYYNKNSQDAGVAEVIASKVRDGVVGTVRIASELQYSRFSNLAYEFVDN